jgi:hypothetical protein
MRLFKDYKDRNEPYFIIIDFSPGFAIKCRALHHTFYYVPKFGTVFDSKDQFKLFNKNVIIIYE